MRFSGANAKQRQEKFDILVSEMGGCCVECGSDTDLEFHHLDPKLKKFDVSGNLTRTISVLREEAEKCILLCYNCHRVAGSKYNVRVGHGYGAYIAKRCDCDICRQSYLDYYTRINRARGKKPRAVAKHGTRSMYTKGCRCDFCRQANRDYNYYRRHPND